MTKKSPINDQSLQIPKSILITAKLLQAISPKLATLFAVKLFSTPIKHKIPKREWQMEQNTSQQKLEIPKINKTINLYHYGESQKKVLLVHGWSGRGTQLFKIAEELLQKGFSTISFDAPAHGKSKSNTTLMPEFIASIHEIDKQFGPFEFAIGHSLGGMSILKAIKEGFLIKKAVIIGSGDAIENIIEDFIFKLQLKPNIGALLKEHFEKKFNVQMENYRASFVAQSIDIPVLVIHDANDQEISSKAAQNIHSNLKNGEILITEKLGHRKILGDKKVIESITSFLVTDNGL